ncbi:Fe-S cluster assembly ATPase SufC [Methanotorris igneus]|uniref:ABC transporter related protein n=1 Tax=Methanotorris igneus (strain DSM 5666 / JCM 11834 / Kol 5) TaxID=880724 RepID=F6BCS5_METIK|nr:Fe-S cluster assembly ATPase SufC [Methanotorris igneus]AEF96286.1 ABC transporter related protein [Methanotorris igneus Kol 5]
MLEIHDLSVKIGDKTILKDLNLKINEGEVHVLFGPNGTGKSTLIGTILGNPKYEVVGGEMIFKGEDITNLPMHERAKRGIGILFQTPPAIQGVKLLDLLKIIAKRDEKEILKMAKRLKFENFLDRDVNVGFSGGERKKSEILQLYAQNPDFIMFDEPDSGVDVENVELIGRIINEMLDKNKEPDERRKSGLIVTHLGYILNFIDADKAHVLYNGKIILSGKPKEILNRIVEEGYEGVYNDSTR